VPDRGRHLAAELSEREQFARRIALRQWVWGIAVNLVGALIALTYLAFVFPPDPDDGRISIALNLVALGIYLPAAMALGSRRVRHAARALRTWAASDRAPTDVERRLVLRLPVINAISTGGLWLVAAGVFALLNREVSGAFAGDVFGTVVLCGIVVTTAEFLGNERLMRPAVARVLSTDPPPEAGALGVGPRIVLTWLLCAATPLVGIALVPVGRVPDDPEDLARPLAFLAACAVIAGGVAMTLAARAVSVPLRRVRRAMDDVTEGRLDIEVDVDDGSEIGRLEAGFNRMVEGLRERERMRDLFGRQVGADVARRALEHGVELGGQTREVSALFVDVVGSTALATREQPERVVELLNAFFETVVGAVEREDGLVNKFEGDAALCVFGAPVEQPDHAARALRAARELGEKLRAHEGFDAAVGVSSGEAVAGNVGTERRFEYTVIGDPVNEAARLTELAKEDPCRVLASEAIVRAAGEPEASEWELGDEVALRGRDAPTRLARPRDGRA
jgi:adenylate cyclase